MIITIVTFFVIFVISALLEFIGLGVVFALATIAALIVYYHQKKEGPIEQSGDDNKQEKITERFVDELKKRNNTTDDK